jgi:hypothetical protein
MGTEKKTVMLIPVGVSKGGHILKKCNARSCGRFKGWAYQKVVMLVPVEDGHIKKI